MLVACTAPEAEIERALAAGYDPKSDSDAIVFTADLIDEPTLARVHELRIPVNAGSVDMLEQLGKVSPGHRVWLRVNPGFGHGHSQKTNTGGENSKHGIWYADMPAALEVLQRYGLKLVGIHMHIGSGVDYGHLEQVCGAMGVRTNIPFNQLTDAERDRILDDIDRDLATARATIGALPRFAASAIWFTFVPIFANS